jgi:membrane-associated phospholipid phosphatase
VILHPIVLPTIGVFLYFLTIPHSIKEAQRFFLIGFVFATTYLVPLVILILLKGLKIIKSFKVHSIKERKIPLFLMILLFTILGNMLLRTMVYRDFGVLFYGTSFGLIAVYLFSIGNIKVSLHLLSMGSMVGFFMMMGIEYITSVLPLLLLFFALSGLLASSRLHLKAHTPKEVYLGFFFGILAQTGVYYIL